MESSGEHEKRGRWRWTATAGVYLLLLICAFGPLLTDSYPNDDGHGYALGFQRSAWGFGSGAAPGTPRGAWDRLLATARGDLIRAHYVPTTTVTWQALYILVGEEEWPRAVVALSLVLHGLSALLLAILLTRLQFPFLVGFLAGMVFMLHPVAGIGVSGSNGSIRLYGIFLLFVALVTWERNLPGRKLRPWLFATSLLAFFLCLHTNPTFFASAPVLVLGLALVAAGGGGLAFKPWLKQLALRGLPYLGTFGLGLFVRQHFYGRLDTDHTAATTRRLVENRGFPKSMSEHFGLLADPPEVSGSEGEHIALPQAFAADASTLILAGLGVLIAVVATWVVIRRHESQESGPWLRLSLRGVALSALLVLTLPFVYYAVRGDVYLHRYLYVGLPAAGTLGALVAGALLLPLRRLLGARVAATLGALALGVGLWFFAQENLRTVTSVSYGKRAAEAVATTTAELLAERPEVERTYVLNLPGTVGRSGILFHRDWALTNAVTREVFRRHRRALPASNPDKTKTGVVHGGTLIDDWEWLTDSKRDLGKVAVLRFDRESLACVRVGRVENYAALAAPSALDLTLPPTREASQAPGSDLLTSQVTATLVPSPKSRSRTIQAFALAVHDRPQYVLKNAKRLTEKFGRDLEPSLIKLLDSPMASLRREGAKRLRNLWKIEDLPRCQEMLKLSNPRLARAATALLETWEDPAAADLLQCALSYEATRIRAVLALAERGGEVPAEFLADLRTRPDGLSRLAAASLDLRENRPGALEIAGALLVDERLPADARARLLPRLVAAGDARLLGVIDYYLEHQATRAVDQWALLDLIEEASAPFAAHLIVGALAHPAIPSKLKRPLSAQWKKRFPDLKLGRMRRDLATLDQALRANGEAWQPEGATRLGKLVRSVTKTSGDVLPQGWWVEAQLAYLKEQGKERITSSLAGIPEAAIEAQAMAEQLKDIGKLGRGRGKLTLTMEAALALPEIGTGGVRGVILELHNETEGTIPGGPGPLTPELHLQWLPLRGVSQKGPATPRPVLIPLRGLAPGQKLRIPLPLEVPHPLGIYLLQAHATLRGAGGNEVKINDTRSRRSLLTVGVGMKPLH